MQSTAWEGPAIAPGQSWLGVRELERKYALSHGQIAYWIKTSSIDAASIREPEARGKPRLIDEFAVWSAVNMNYQPHSLKPTRAIVVAPSQPTSQAMPTVIPPQVLRPGRPVIEAAPPSLPNGFLPTAQLVQQYLDLRWLAVQRGEIAESTWKLERLYMTKWALHAPAFPWAQADLDSYNVFLGTKKSRWHAIRYVMTLTRWAKKRYEDVRLPTDIKKGEQKPPRHDVLTMEQEAQMLEAIRTHAHNLWVYAMVLTRTGCRAFEVLDMDWENITPQGFVSKGRAKKRAGMVYFPAGIYELLLTLPEPHTGPVFVSERGDRLNSRAIRNRLQHALQGSGIKFKAPIGSYMFRHLFAERMKDRINIERLASIMRTSVEQLEKTYGKHSDDSFRDLLNKAQADVWGDKPIVPKGTDTKA